MGMGMETQYTGADAVASIGNASNMNRGMFDSGNMSGGSFGNRTPVQFGSGISLNGFQSGGEYEMTEEEIAEVYRTGGSVEYL